MGLHKFNGTQGVQEIGLSCTPLGNKIHLISTNIDIITLLNTLDFILSKITLKCINLIKENGTSIWVTAEAKDGIQSGIPEPKCSRFCNSHEDCPGYVNNEQMCMGGLCVEKICPLSLESRGVYLMNNGTNGSIFGAFATVTCM